MSFQAFRLSETPAETEAAPVNSEDMCEDGRIGQPVIFRPDPDFPVVVDPSLGAANEQFGILRARLLNAHSRSGVRSVMITSPQKGEGKSMVCLNLAISFGRLGKSRVLLVDGDLRVRGVTCLLRMNDDSGVCEFLQGKKSFDSCVRSTSLPNLSVAAAGIPPKEFLTTILEGPKWLEFLERAKQRFDIILVDSVPVSAPIADFELMSTASDAVLLIVQLRKTSRDALARAVQQLNSKLLGVIINNADREMDYEYRSYSNAKKK
jgi:capsular exopolysaccharide synthesis family protein